MFIYSDVAVNSMRVREQAMLIAKQLRLSTEFKASCGWCSRFLASHDVSISVRVKCPKGFGPDRHSVRKSFADKEAKRLPDERAKTSYSKQSKSTEKKHKRSHRNSTDSDEFDKNTVLADAEYNSPPVKRSRLQNIGDRSIDSAHSNVNSARGSNYSAVSRNTTDFLADCKSAVVCMDYAKIPSSIEHNNSYDNNLQEARHFCANGLSSSVSNKDKEDREQSRIVELNVEPHPLAMRDLNNLGKNDSAYKPVVCSELYPFQKVASDFTPSQKGVIKQEPIDSMDSSHTENDTSDTENESLLSELPKSTRILTEWEMWELFLDDPNQQIDFEGFE